MSHGRITIGFSSHQIEVLPFVRRQMELHQTIILEEAPSPLFQDMMADLIPIEDYLLEDASQFPQFDTQMCELTRGMHFRGKRILQVEPFMERLIQIHELLAAGKTKEDVRVTSELREVYETESAANGALIAFYSASVRAPFAEVAEAVKDYEKTDANLLRLRENLRARAIASIAGSSESIFVEAGYIHYLLYRYLQPEIGAHRKVKVVYPMDESFRNLKGKRRNMGPGDILTLHYLLGHNPPRGLADLLAARSLIYIKMIEKEELHPGVSPTPHCEHEVRVNRMVDRLSLEDCAKIFGRSVATQ